MAEPPKTPAGRALARILLLIHIVLASAFCVPLVVGATARAFAPPAAATTAPCASEAAALFEEVIARASAVPASTLGKRELRSFEAFAQALRPRLAEMQARCPAERPALQATERLLAATEVHAASWSRHVGPVADEARLENARLKP